MIQAVRGVRDCLPIDTPLWQYIEDIIKNVFITYGYREIRLPIIEQYSLFRRAIGGITDVIEKEMYVFQDRSGENISLRPEGTSGCVRAGIEHDLFRNREQRFWYMGPMFRYERPQKGRYRQFHQLSVEMFGQFGPDVDAELIMLTTRCWKKLGISKYISLEINSIGSPECRAIYCKDLISFFTQHLNNFSSEFGKRLYSNPMGLLDSKDLDVKKILCDAPSLIQYLDENSRIHFHKFCKLLDYAHINYKINPYLVRGLDYYNRTVFEWVTDNLGTQRTICAGGRYDNLVQQLGGGNVPAVGCAIGLERLVLLFSSINNTNFLLNSYSDIYFISIGTETQAVSMFLSEQIRDAFPSLKLIMNYGGGSIKRQFRRANAHHARVVLLLGDTEITMKQVTIKDLLLGRQEVVNQSDLIIKLSIIFS